VSLLAIHALCAAIQHFFSFFKTLVGHDVVVELKNDLALKGQLHSVDQYLNVKLENVDVLEKEKYPHMVGCSETRLLGLLTAFCSSPSRRSSFGARLCAICT
jgi:small nuclear ribonucleoprotein (snRNP)-like protein